MIPAEEHGAALAHCRRMMTRLDPAAAEGSTVPVGQYDCLYAVALILLDLSDPAAAEDIHRAGEVTA